MIEVRLGLRLVRSKPKDKFQSCLFSIKERGYKREHPRWCTPNVREVMSRNRHQPGDDEWNVLQASHVFQLKALKGTKKDMRDMGGRCRLEWRYF